MRTLKDKFSVGVFGENWSKQTVDLIKGSNLCDCVNVFQYTHREALFIDQYDFFLITDFCNNGIQWSEEYRDKLNQLREIICTRSMKTIIIANDDDVDISTSLREAWCRVVRVSNFLANQIPQTFASLLLCELCGARNNSTQKHHFPAYYNKQTQFNAA